MRDSVLECLDKKKLTDVFKWEPFDDILTESIREAMPREEKLPDFGVRKFPARHIIAASVLNAVQIPDNELAESSIERIEKIFNSMKKYLIAAFAKHPEWSQGQHIITERP